MGASVAGRADFEGAFWNERVVLEVDPDLGEPMTGPVGRLFRTPTLGGSAKWNHYFPIYDRFLGPHAGRDLRILEIGVGRGGSLGMWQRFLGAGARIVGIDVREEVGQLAGGNVEIRIGRQGDREFLARVVDELGPFDVILDDGSHLVSDQVGSFEVLYPDLELDPGLYIVEDLHSNYWSRLTDARPTFVELMTDLVHEMHEPYTTIKSALDTVVTGVDDGELRIHGSPLSEAPTVEVSRFAATTRGIHFFDSVIVVEKARRYLPTHESIEGPTPVDP